MKCVQIVLDDREGWQAEEEIFVNLGVIVGIGELFQHLVGDKNLNIPRGVPRYGVFWLEEEFCGYMVSA